MSVSPESYRCDAAGCGKTRKNDANHWVSAIITKKSVRFVEGIRKKALHYCGLTCAMKGLQDWFFTLVNANKSKFSEPNDV
jgi:hypothetical protein